MSKAGQGGVYRPTYTYKGEKRKSSIYWCYYSIDGKKHRERTGKKTQREAIAFLNDRLRERGRGLSMRDLEKVTFSDLEALITADYAKNNRKSTDRMELALDHLRKRFGAWRVVDITEGPIDRYAADRLEDGAAAATVNRELAALRRMFHLADRARLVSRVPTFDLLEEDNVRKGFVADGQFQALHDALPPRLQPIATTAFVTGWRLSEIMSREWRHVDFGAGWLRLEPGETKNKKGRQFPLIPRLRASLESQRERRDAIQNQTGKVIRPLWFYLKGKRAGKPIKDFRGAWASATDKAGCPDLLFHDFRRTAVRNMVRAGIPEKVAMEYTGHLTRSVFDRYNIVDEDMLREQAKKLTAHLDAVEQAGERKVVPLAVKERSKNREASG